MAKRKQLIIENVELPSAGAKGVAVGRTEEGKAIFVKGAVPGDLAHVRVTRKKKSHLMGEVKELLRPSEDRVQAECQHFDLCGGCVWQNLDYTSQLKWKANEVRQNLARLGGVEVENEEEILPSTKTFFYRNKLEYSFSSERWLTESEIESGADISDRRALGFHIPGRWDRVFEVDKCLLQPDPSNAIRNRIGEMAREKGWTFYHPKERVGWLRSMMIRNNLAGDFMLIIQTANRDETGRKELTEMLLEEFPQIKSLWFTVNSKQNDSIYDLDLELIHGDEVIIEEMPAYKGGRSMQFRIGPKSFYQTNPEQASELYRIALDYAEVDQDSLVYDLYTGTGTIALYLAQQAGRVIGVEGVEDAVIDAGKNAKANGIENASFYAGDMRKVLTQEFVDEHGKPDVIVTDPPREGMHPDVVELMMEIAPPRIVYVSCNSATQARDLGLLKEKYKIVKSRAVDMFPHTAHVENVALLERR